MPSSWTIIPLDKSIETDHFSCGDKFFDDFLKKHALFNQEKGLCEVYVAVAPTNTKHALGYFTLSTSSIERMILPKKDIKGLPKYERYPTVLLGMLARADSEKGSGLGDILLVHALQMAKKTKTVGFMGIELIATNDKVAGWYKRYGFIVLQKRQDGRTIMFLHRDAIP